MLFRATLIKKIKKINNLFCKFASKASDVCNLFKFTLTVVISHIINMVCDYFMKKNIIGFVIRMKGAN